MRQNSESWLRFQGLQNVTTVRDYVSQTLKMSPASDGDKLDTIIKRLLGDEEADAVFISP